MGLRTISINWGFGLFVVLAVVACVFFNVSWWVPVLSVFAGVKVSTTHRIG